MQPGRPRVILLSRPGCGLCDEARALLRRLGYDGSNGGFEEVDISRDAELERRYLVEIPVIVVDGIEVARAPLTESGLRAVLPAPPRRAARR